MVVQVMKLSLVVKDGYFDTWELLNTLQKISTYMSE